MVQVQHPSKMMIPATPTEILIVGGIIYLVYLLLKFRDRAIQTTKRKDSKFPELRGWPLIGQLPQVIMEGTRPLESGTIKRYKYGVGYSETLPGIRLIDISKPEWIEYVQKTNFNNYVKGPSFQAIVADAFGLGIFATDGPIWKKSRYATSTIFSVHTFKSIMVPAADRSMTRVIDYMKFVSQEKRNVDLCDIFFRFTLEAFVLMTFGRDLGLLSQLSRTEFGSESFEAGDQKDLSKSSIAFVEAFDFVQNQLNFRFTVVKGWSLVEKLNWRMGRKMKAACRVLDDYAYSLIDERITGKELHREQGFFSKDLLDLFRSACDERGNHLSRTEIRDAALNLIIAGRDTTAEALSWSFFHLLMNEDLVTKVREEAIEILGEDLDHHHPGVTFENYKRFVWTYSVVLETLRLHPSVPRNMKFALAHDKIPNGPVIEPGDCVRWSDWQMGRDHEIWGPDCGEFKPERWIDQQGSIKQVGEFKFHAFNGGPRRCLGINLSLFESVKMIVETLREFDLEFAGGWYQNVPKSQNIEGLRSKYEAPMYRPSLTLQMKQPMIVSIKLRQS